MEAVLESLKDMEIRNPQAEQSTVPAEPSLKDDQQASSQEFSKPIETSSSSIKSKVESVSDLAGEMSETLEVKSQNLADTPSPAPINDSSLNTSVSSFSSDSLASVPSSSDTDISHNTKATLTVEKNNEAGHAKDGRRWDFNFFRNSNSK